jgi:hypothetical protein
LKEEIAVAKRELDAMVQRKSSMQSTVTKLKEDMVQTNKTATAAAKMKDELALFKQENVQQKDQQLQQLESRVNCVICYERARDMIIFPCTHFVCCQNCTKQLNNQCPMCRGSVASVLHTKLT